MMNYYDKITRNSITNLVNLVKEHPDMYTKEEDYMKVIGIQMKIETAKMLFDMAVMVKTIRKEAKFYKSKAYAHIGGNGSITFVGSFCKKAMEVIKIHRWDDSKENFEIDFLRWWR